MKLPKTDAGKTSLCGLLRVKRNPITGLEEVFPRDPNDESYDGNDLLRVVYDRRPIDGIWEDFDTIRNRTQRQWNDAPKRYDPISSELKKKISDWIENQRKVLAHDVV
jgi:nicotinamide phosphoribosyltransferase